MMITAHAISQKIGTKPMVVNTSGPLRPFQGRPNQPQPPTPM